jgi:hypothetical protein
VAASVHNSSGTADLRGAANIDAVSGADIASHLKLNAGVRLEAGSIRDNSLTIGPGATVRLRAQTNAQSSRLFGLAISGGPGAWSGKLDIADNPLVLKYTGPSPLPTIADQIRTAFASGAWAGNGVGSSLADKTRFGVGYAEASVLFPTLPATFAGQSVDSPSLLIDLARYGDANLDREIDLDDVLALGTHWQRAGDWSDGDFNYDGFVDFDDLRLLANNWLQGPEALDATLVAAGLPTADLPEPGALLACGAALWVTLRFRGRRRHAFRH